MKLSTCAIATLIILATPFLHASNSSSACNNQDETPCKKGPCEEDGEGDSGACSEASIINNGRMRYFTWAKDFSFEQSGPTGCSPCGSKASTATTLASLEVNRITSYKTYNHANSFGQRSSLVKYDKHIYLNASSNRVFYFDPGSTSTATYILNYDSAIGAWKFIDVIGIEVESISLFKEDGTPITTAAERDQAHTGMALNFDGTTEHFEIIWRTNGTAVGRLTTLMDRNGNSETVHYHLAQPASPSLRVASSQDYLKKTSIEDAYGRSAQISSKYLSGRWVISQIEFPNGEKTTYNYTQTSRFGSAVISNVVHPDSSQSNWDFSEEPGTLYQKLSIYEPHGSPMKRRKTLFGQGTVGIDNNGNTIGTVDFLARRVTNGDGEVIYSNRADVSGRRYFYEGGNMVRFIDIAIGRRGGVTSVGYLTSEGDPVTNFNTPDLSGFEEEIASTRTNSTRRLIISLTSALPTQTPLGAKASVLMTLLVI